MLLLDARAGARRSFSINYRSSCIEEDGEYLGRA